MPFLIDTTPTAGGTLEYLAVHDAKKHRKVLKALGYLSLNPRHSELNSHRWESRKGPNGEEIWESYVENKTPAAWRIFWYYGPESGTITVIAITPHP